MFVRTVLYAVLAFVIVALGFGFLAPSLISSQSDIGVMVGFLIIPLVVILEYWILKSWMKQTS